MIALAGIGPAHLGRNAMNRTGWWLSIAGCLVLAACASDGFHRGVDARGHARVNDQTCNANAPVCNIDVRVDCSSGCVAIVDPKVLLMFRQQGQMKQIHWHLKGAPGYVFANVEVTLDPAEFDCLKPGEHQVLAICKDRFKNPNPDVYEYQLKVVKESDGSTLTIDPWIVPK